VPHTPLLCCLIRQFVPAFVPDWHDRTVDETDTFVGHGTPVSVTTPGPIDTGIPGAPGHDSPSNLFGLSPPPGVSFNIQVTKIPNR
jgi:hypothetical protein